MTINFAVSGSTITATINGEQLPAYSLINQAPKFNTSSTRVSFLFADGRYLNNILFTEVSFDGVAFSGTRTALEDQLTSTFTPTSGVNGQVNLSNYDTKSQVNAKDAAILAQVYAVKTAATVSAANTLISESSQKMIITVAADENNGGLTTRYTYEGSGGLVADFTKASSTQFQMVNGQEEINTTWLNSFIATYLSSNGFTAGGGGTNAAPVASSVAFTGTPTQGQTLTGTYTYSDAESNAEGTSLKKWYRSDNTSALNRTAISGATATTYVLQAADVGKFIQYAITPVSTTGTTTGTEVFSAYSAVIAAPAAATLAAITSWPTLSSVTQSTNNLSFATTGTGSAVSSKFIPSGGTGEVWITYDEAGITGYVGVSSGTGATAQSSMTISIWKEGANKFRTRDGSNFTAPATDNALPISPNSIGRIRFTGTTIFTEVSIDGGTTWAACRNIPQPASDLYVKAFFDTNPSNARNIRQLNLN